MATALKMFYSSVGRKLVMALTGLFLCMFLLEHLYGNLLLYKLDGGEAFNDYTETMTSNLLIRIVEIGLFAGILIHAIDGMMLTMANRKARPVKYAVSNQSGNSSWFSRNMGLTGSIIFIFLVIHLKKFFIVHRFGHPETTMSQDVALAFQSHVYTILYVVAMILLGAHLNHGFQSAFQTLGWNNKKYAPMLKSSATAFALLMVVGFASFPIIIHFDLFGIATNLLP
jgi:succinate dehydrogenase / fumarate reductase cytochrome b subunit